MGTVRGLSSTASRNIFNLRDHQLQLDPFVGEPRNGGLALKTRGMSEPKFTGKGNGENDEPEELVLLEAPGKANFLKKMGMGQYHDGFASTTEAPSIAAMTSSDDLDLEAEESSDESATVEETLEEHDDSTEEYPTMRPVVSTAPLILGKGKGMGMGGVMGPLPPPKDTTPIHTQMPSKGSYYSEIESSSASSSSSKSSSIKKKKKSRTSKSNMGMAMFTEVPTEMPTVMPEETGPTVSPTMMRCVVDSFGSVGSMAGDRTLYDFFYQLQVVEGMTAEEVDDNLLKNVEVVMANELIPDLFPELCGLRRKLQDNDSSTAGGYYVGLSTKPPDFVLYGCKLVFCIYPFHWR